MTAIGLAALTALAFLLRWPTFRIALENNAGAYLYNARFRTDEVDCTGIMGLVHVLALGYRVFGERWRYRWVRGVSAAANALVVPPAYLLGTALGGPVAGWVAAGAYAVFSSVPHLIPWFTAGERIYVPLSTGAYAAFAASVGHPPLFVALSGLLAGACVLCKVTSAAEFIPLAVLIPFTSKGTSDELLRLALLAVGSAVVPGLEALRLWRRGRLGSFTGSVRHLRERYRQADIDLAEVRAGGSENPALKWWLDLLSGTMPVWAFAIPWMAHAIAVEGTPLARGVCAWYAVTLATTAYRGNWVPGHWVPQIPPLAVMAGAGFAGLLAAGGAFGLPLFLAFTLVLAGSVWAWVSGRRHPWSVANYEGSQRIFEEAGSRLQALTTEGERIFCWGWHPQVYLFAGRASACPRFLFCGKKYLDTIEPGWRWELAQAFVAHRPRCVAILSPALPLQEIHDLTGLEYKIEVERPVAICRLVEGTGLAHDPSEPLDVQARRLARAALEAGNGPGAVVRLRALVALRGGDAEAEAILDDTQPGWRWVASGMLPEPPGELVLEEARQGGRTLGVRVGEEVRWLHSRYAPRTEAERIADDIVAEWADAYLLVGLGLGHVAAEISRRTTKETLIYAVERRRSVARAAISEVEDLRNGRVRVVAAAPPATLSPLFQTLVGRKVRVHVLPPAQQLDPEYCAEVLAEVQKRMQPPAQA